MSAAALLAGYAADLATGDPARWHPVAGFGRLAGAAERLAYAPSRLRGAVVTATLVAAAAAAAELVARRSSRRATLVAVTWGALGGRSLRREARAVGECVRRGELDHAREALRSLCGRDATELDAPALCRAVVESLAENTSDAVVGALVWGAVGGPSGVVAYRAVNTLDAMFGHRDERYRAFGWSAARLDDVMNWPAARLSAALTCLVAPLVGGSPIRTLATVRRDGPSHPSPNAGRVEAAFAGALGVRLGGPLVYKGVGEVRPYLGNGRVATPGDIQRAARLSLAVSTLAALLTAAARRWCVVGAVIGTAWHAALEHDDFRRALLARVAAAPGRRFVAGSGSFSAARAARLDALGDLVADHLDTSALVSLIDHGAPADLPTIDTEVRDLAALRHHS